MSLKVSRKTRMQNVRRERIRSRVMAFGFFDVVLFVFAPLFPFCALVLVGRGGVAEGERRVIFAQLLSRSRHTTASIYIFVRALCEHKWPHTFACAPSATFVCAPGSRALAARPAHTHGSCERCKSSRSASALCVCVCSPRECAAGRSLCDYSE